MARIMLEEWPEGVSCEAFVLERFPKDTIGDLEKAVEIFAELESADAAVEDLERWQRRTK